MARATLFDIGVTKPGNLVIVPSPSLSNNAWYSDFSAPYAFKTVTGNFAVIARINLVSSADTSQTPQNGQYDSGGFVLRNPDSVAGGASHQNWVMYNFGFQTSPANYAREAKTTRASGNADPSYSTLYLNPISVTGSYHSGQLMVARLGDRYCFFHWMDNETAWAEEVFNPSIPPLGNGVGMPGGGEPNPPLLVGGVPAAEFVRPDLHNASNQVQVGLVANSWVAATNGTRAEFDYIRFSTPAPTITDCQTFLSTQ